MSLHCSLHSSRNRRSSFASIFAFAEYRPCFQFARFERANPLFVRGPVLVPPCIRQRPLCRPGPLQGAPFRVLAPHRGAVLGSPAGLPFLSHPRRFAWGSLIAISFIPLPRSWPFAVTVPTTAWPPLFTCTCSTVHPPA